MLNLCVTVKCGRTWGVENIYTNWAKNISIFHYASLSFILCRILKLLTHHTFLPLTVAKLSMLKQVQFFIPSLYMLLFVVGQNSALIHKPEIVG